MSAGSRPSSKPRPGEPGWKPGRFTELRVHGVGNTPMIEVIDDSDPVRATGDELAGFYRPRNASRPEDPSAPPVSDQGALNDRADLEAYDWGGFNTGGGWRAFWFVLLPFTLMNIAGWMVIDKDKWARRWVRLFGLGVTTSLVAWVGALAIDIIALQCGSQKACVDRQIWLKPLDWFDGAGPRMVITLVIPLVLLGLLWWFAGRRSRDRYERFDRPPEDLDRMAGQWNEYFRPGAEGATGVNAAPSPADVESAKTIGLVPDIWFQDREVRGWARYHAAAAVALLGAALAFAASSLDPQVPFGFLGGIGIAIYLVVAAAVLYGPKREPNDLGERRVDVTVHAVRVVVIALIYFIVIATATAVAGSEALPMAFDGALDTDQVDAAATVMESNATVATDFMRTLTYVNATVLLLGSVGLIFHRLSSRKGPKTRVDERRLLKGWGPYSASMTALLLVVMMAIGGALWMAEWLGDRPEEILDRIGVTQDGCRAATSTTPDLAGAYGKGYDVCSLLDDEGLDAFSSPGQLIATATTSPAVVDSTATTTATTTTTVPRVDSLAELPYLAEAAAQEAEVARFLAEPVIVTRPIHDMLAVWFLAAICLLLVGFGSVYVIVVWRLRHNRAAVIRVTSGEDQSNGPPYPVLNDLRTAARTAFLPRSYQERKHWVKSGNKELRKSPRNTRLPYLLSIPAILVTASTVMLFDAWVRNSEGINDVHQWVLTDVGWLLTAATLAITFAFLGMAAMIQRSRSPAAQASTGGMWDVITYWPRSYHPFAIPSYGVRAVPELAQRVKILTDDIDDDEQRRLLLTAHSGGVMVTLAALMLIPDKNRKRVALLTYGNPVGSLVSQAYPEYFSAQQMRAIARLLYDDGIEDIRWRNLWRLTDWTGGYGFGPWCDKYGEDDLEGTQCIEVGDDSLCIRVKMDILQMDPAVATLDAVQSTEPLPIAIGHTDYFHDPKKRGPEDPRYKTIRAELVRGWFRPEAGGDNSPTEERADEVDDLTR